ncbi:nadph:quinone reductase [Gigaspora margarita]|uniref:Probable quinone oxidoreductase n=1 Tax=Gigaspora margarita TaxID=4874 RepID=A0A8H3WXN3_GIGMA|nr:nadph:quinone reductase [Gigaspora margarita]
MIIAIARLQNYRNCSLFRNSKLFQFRGNFAMASSMKAIQIKNTGGVEVLEHVIIERPKITGLTDVLVKNHFAGVNFIDTYHRSGLYKLSLPAIIGREGAGVVEAVGDGVKDIRPGDHVVYVSPSSYAEFTIANSKKVAKVPDGLDLKLAAASLLQGLTAWVMITQSYEVKKDDWILIHAAAGGVGLLLVQLVKNCGAHVIGTVSNDEKAKLAISAGAEHIINYSNQNVVDEVMRITDNKGVHAIYDGVGKDTFETSLACARRLGSLISFGNASGKVPPFEILRLSEKNLKLMRPTLNNYIETEEEFRKSTAELFTIIKEGKLDIKIWKTYKLNDAKQAHLDLEGRKTTGKLILKL